MHRGDNRSDHRVGVLCRYRPAPRGNRLLQAEPGIYLRAVCVLHLVGGGTGWATDNRLNQMQWTGCLMVFGGIIIEMVAERLKPHDKSKKA
eukprot:759921-Hanusia_phi.AAC.3